MASGEINQRRVRATAEHLTVEGLNSSNAKVFLPGTVMVAMNGQGATRGKASVLEIEAACNQSLAAVQSGQQSDNQFLFQVLDTAYEELRSLTGDGRNGLNLGLIRTIPILLPPLLEQRAIAAVLDAIDEAIECTEAVITATERLRDALLHELLTRGVPGWHTAWRDVSGLGTMPASWEVVRLGDVAEVNRSNWDPSESSTIHYLDLTAVVAPGSLALPRELAATDAPSRARRRVQSGDILVSTVRPNLRGFARVTVAPENLIASTGFAVVSPGPRVNGSLVYHHVLTNRFAQWLEDATTGQAYPAVRPTDVADFLVPLPCLLEQSAIAGLLDSVGRAIELGHKERDGLQSLKASAADALLTGRVRV